MVFKHFWTPFPFPVANFHFQTPFSPTFCHYNAQNMRNLEKKMLTSGEKSIHFRFLFFRF
jgi:hypothetical protein